MAVPCSAHNQTAVAEFTVPDGFVGTIIGFGHEVLDPAHWGTLVWNIIVNGFPVRCYQNFTNQIGEYQNPMRFPNPIRLKHGDKLWVTVNNQGDEEACVFVRLIGFMFPAKMLTQDGSYNEYHTI